jgi:hypothetical protein
MRLGVFLFLLSAAGLAAQGPPPPPAPPAFMSMKGLPLACFDKPAFEEDGLEFFVCQGGAGLGGVRKNADPARQIYVGDPDIALNLNMQEAKADCPKGRFGVRYNFNGTFSFICDKEEIRRRERFQLASKADWKKYLRYLDKLP